MRVRSGVGLMRGFVDDEYGCCGCGGYYAQKTKTEDSADDAEEFSR
jgi:hypothetical protein